MHLLAKHEQKKKSRVKSKQQRDGEKERGEKSNRKSKHFLCVWAEVVEHTLSSGTKLDLFFSSIFCFSFVVVAFSCASDDSLKSLLLLLTHDVVLLVAWVERERERKVENAFEYVQSFWFYFCCCCCWCSCCQNVNVQK